MTALEALNFICCNCNQNYFDYEKQRNIVKTALKALEIIKEKRVNVDELWFIFQCEKTHEQYDGLFEYNDVYTYVPKVQLTREEYDLLKEVLCLKN